MKIFRYLWAAMLISVNYSYADLRPISDEDLGSLTGQALFKLTETPSETDNDIVFSRLTMGLKIEMNSTIEELSLGTFYRQDGVQASVGRTYGVKSIFDSTPNVSSICHYDGRFCDNDIGNFTEWNCTVSECGGIQADPHSNNASPFQVGALVYGNLIGLSGGDKLLAALAQVVNKDGYAYNQPFSNSTLFPSGFEYTSGTDVKLRDVSMGRILNVDGKEIIEDFVIEKPFVEFAYDDATAVRKIVGVRIGFGTATGTQGNAIDVISGFVKPVVTATADATIGKATFSFAPYLGGVRTPGYIDPSKTQLVGGCDGSSDPLGIVCGSVDSAEKIAEASPQAQLFPLQSLKMENSPTFWLSFQSQDVKYNKEKVVRNGESVEYEYEVAKAGAWMNIGALSVQANGSDVDLSQLSNYTGVLADTSKPLHADNYYAANPISARYTDAYFNRL